MQTIISGSLPFSSHRNHIHHAQENEEMMVSGQYAQESTAGNLRLQCPSCNFVAAGARGRPRWGAQNGPAVRTWPKPLAVYSLPMRFLLYFSRFCAAARPAASPVQQEGRPVKARPGRSGSTCPMRTAGTSSSSTPATTRCRAHRGRQRGPRGLRVSPRHPGFVALSGCPRQDRSRREQAAASRPQRLRNRHRRPRAAQDAAHALGRKASRAVDVTRDGQAAGSRTRAHRRGIAGDVDAGRVVGGSRVGKSRRGRRDPNGRQRCLRHQREANSVSVSTSDAARRRAIATPTARAGRVHGGRRADCECETAHTMT